MSGNGKFTVESCDNVVFEVDDSLVFASEMLKNVIEVNGVKTTIPLPTVKAETLTMIIQYCKYDDELRMSYDENGTVPEEEIKRWHAEFVKVEIPILVELLKAAYDLKIENLQDFLAETLAAMIRNKSTEEIRRVFGIVNDFTPEEEVRRSVRRQTEAMTE